MCVIHSCLTSYVSSVLARPVIDDFRNKSAQLSCQMYLCRYFCRRYQMIALLSKLMNNPNSIDRFCVYIILMYYILRLIYCVCNKTPIDLIMTYTTPMVSLPDILSSC